MKSIHHIIVKLANKKGQGYDLIINKILKNLTPKVLSYLAILCNLAMRFCTLETIIISIHKPEKSAHSPSSYRPFSIFISLLKFYERILLSKLKSFAHVIPKYQFGFKTHHSKDVNLRNNCKWLWKVTIYNCCLPRRNANLRQSMAL